MTPRRREPGGHLVIGCLVLAVTLVGVAPAVAVAHGDKGELELVRLEESRPLELRMDVRVAYAGDGDPAEGAAVTVLARLTDGTTAGPVALAAVPADAGVYGATLELPRAGTWRFEVASDHPAGALTVERSIGVVGEGAGRTASTTLPEDDVVESRRAAGWSRLMLPAALVALGLAAAALVLVRRRRDDP